MEIRYVPYAIANNYGSYIELNENLQKYPNLHSQILQHELGHSNKQGFTKEDALHDIRQLKISYLELLKFMIKYPKTLAQFLPFYIREKTLFYDINMCIVWILTIVITGIGLFLILK